MREGGSHTAKETFDVVTAARPAALTIHCTEWQPLSSISADSGGGTAILVLSSPAWVKWPWRRLGRAGWRAVLLWESGVANVQYLGKRRSNLFRG
jgi:hypothetical protein